MPTKKVDYLAALLVNRSSELYQSDSPIIKQLAGCIDPSLPVLSLQNSLGLDPSDSNPTDDKGTAANTSKMSNKTTAFVASAAALGAIVVAVGAFFGSRYAMKKRAEAAAGASQGSRSSGSGSSFSSRRQYRSGPDYGSAAAPMDQSDYQSDYPRDSEYYGTQSEYPVTERDSMRDTYGSYASRPPTGPLPDPPEGYRQSFDSESRPPTGRQGASSFYPTERSYGAPCPCKSYLHGETDSKTEMIHCWRRAAC